MNQAYSFLRFSRPEQGKGDSIRRQTAATEAWCSRNGFQLVQLEPLRGVSAFKGEQRTNGSLAGFLKLAEDGKLAEGSTLIVESLDRLSREGARKAVSFIFSILDAGIDIVTTNPEHHFKHDATNDMLDVVQMVMILGRANDESEMKSVRGKANWTAKRTTAAVGKPISARCPAWLKMKADKTGFEATTENAKTIKLIFDLAANGYGVQRIAKHLNRNKIPHFGGKVWHEGYLMRILHNRQVIGEYQPCSERKPVGEPVKGYYPPLISEVEFLKASNARAKRYVGGGGRAGNNIPNLFRGLIFNPRGGAQFQYVPPKKKHPHSVLSPNGGRNGTSINLSFRYEWVEKSILTYLKEITVADLTGVKPISNLDALNVKLEDLTNRIEKLIAAMDNDNNLDILFAKLGAWQNEKKELVKQIDAEKVAMSSTEGDKLAETHSLIGIAQDEETRTRLKSAIASIVNKIWMLVIQVRLPGSKGRVKTVRAAIMTIVFKSGVERQIYVQGGPVIAYDCQFIDLAAYQGQLDHVIEAADIVV